jgi:ankyrin repeat protein
MQVHRSRPLRSLAAAFATVFAARCSSGPDPSLIFNDPAAAKVAAAAADDNASEVTALLKAGADPNAIGDKQVSLLQWALLNRSTASMEALLGAGADPAHGDDSGDTVVHYAAKANDARYLDLLLAHHVDPNVPNTITGKTPLMEALLGERHDHVRKLLEAGANPNQADRMGNNAVHVAAQINEAGHVLEMLQAGANPHATNKQGATFQRFLHQTPANLLNAESRREREKLYAWMREHDVPVEGAVR